MIHPGGEMSDREKLNDWTRRSAALTLVFACVVLAVPFTDVAVAQDAVASGDGAYTVPVPAWVADAALDLKREFVMGVARQAVSMAEESATEEVKLLVDASDDIALAGKSVESNMSTIGSIDSSFGIPGISRLVTAEGAVRDTLFGFVVWHESAAGESREMAREFEAAVGKLISLGAAARSHAKTLANNADEVREALAAEDYAGIASSSGVVDEATLALETIANEAEDVSTKIEEIVWAVQDDGSSLLETEWQQVLLAVSDTRRLAAKMRPALVALREGSGASEALSSGLQGMVESIAMMEQAQADENGSVHYPASLFELDYRVVSDLERNVTGQGEAAFPQESADSIEWLLSKVVAADRMLAERSVEYTSTSVARAMDLLENHYKREVGFDESLSGRDRVEAYEPVDAGMRGNGELQSARTSAREARAALEGSKTLEIKGSGSWGDALKNYSEAWARSDEAGESAVRSLKTLN
jgi:hypothetical protein